MFSKRKRKATWKWQKEGEWLIMGEQQDVILTQEGYDKLEEELNYLKQK